MLFSPGATKTTNATHRSAHRVVRATYLKLHHAGARNATKRQNAERRTHSSEDSLSSPLSTSVTKANVNMHSHPPTTRAQLPSSPRPLDFESTRMCCLGRLGATLWIRFDPLHPSQHDCCLRTLGANLSDVSRPECHSVKTNKKPDFYLNTAKILVGIFRRVQRRPDLPHSLPHLNKQRRCGSYDRRCIPEHDARREEKR